MNCNGDTIFHLDPVIHTPVNLTLYLAHFSWAPPPLLCVCVSQTVSHNLSVELVGYAVNIVNIIVHCRLACCDFVSLIEYFRRSGLEQEDIKTFYQYLLSWLFPSQLDASSSVSSTLHHPTSSPSTANTPSTAGGGVTASQVGVSASKAPGGSPVIPRTGRWVCVVTVLIGHCQSKRLQFAGCLSGMHGLVVFSGLQYASASDKQYSSC